GSIAAAHSPMAVPPPPSALVAKAATAALLAAAQLDPAQLPALVRGADSAAAELARRLGGWDPSATLAHRHHAEQCERHGTALAAAAPPPSPSPAA
ncbi:hypothetical protein PYV61_19650, partial [Roseisolibacter sp. H3M3-2]